MTGRQKEIEDMEIGLADQTFDRIGGFVDSLFLGVPRILKPFKPPRNIDRDTYARQAAFYIDEGYADNPASFFDLPETLPDYQVVEEQPYQDGRCQIITWENGYTPRNPLIRNGYLRFDANRTAYLVRWTHGDRNRKTILCLHGYMLGEPRQARRMFKIRRLFNMGLDVCLFIAPFHWRRAPKNPALRGIFLQPDDVAMTCECIGQTMHDLRQAFSILNDLGAEKIGIIGASLGGYNSALYACLSDRPAFAAMMVPAVDFSQPFGPGSIRMKFAIDNELGRQLDRVWRLHSPMNFMPRIPKDRILFIASRGDLLCPFEHILELWEKWGRPRRHFMTGGHWLMFRPGERGKAWYEFLGDMGFGKEVMNDE
jgi:pimeloyl-ACP methyl ester carboxylesterase